MQETIINWQGFEAWTPQWDVVLVLGAAVVLTGVLILLLRTEKEE